MTNTFEFRTVEELLIAYGKGQRIFEDWDFNDDNSSVEGENLSDATFRNCFMFMNFRNAILSGTQFISCNIKMADFRGADLSNVLIQNCSVESTMFKGANTQHLRFEENYCYGAKVGHSDFEETFKDSDEALIGYTYNSTYKSSREYLYSRGGSLRCCTNDVQPSIPALSQIAEILDVDVRELLVCTK
ncbi:MAG: pentapeptide repeat-containing protein [Fluviicola sp.]